jgi:accessory gene regulator protein AgrB
VSVLLIGGIMDQNVGPDFSSGEVCIVILILASVISAMTSEFSTAGFALSISFGLISIALTIYVVGRQLQRESPD